MYYLLPNSLITREAKLKPKRSYYSVFLFLLSLSFSTLSGNSTYYADANLLFKILTIHACTAKINSYFRDTGLACYLTRWISADALKCSAFAGNMFETFMVSEILKSYTNEGKDYRFNIFYYRGRDKNMNRENEIDLIIEEDGIVYPVEIKMSGNPKANMGVTNPVLDKIKNKTRGTGVILCLIDKKTFLRENLVALPIEYI